MKQNKTWAKMRNSETIHHDSSFSSFFRDRLVKIKNKLFSGCFGQNFVKTRFICQTNIPKKYKVNERNFGFIYLWEKERGEEWKPVKRNTHTCNLIRRSCSSNACRYDEVNDNDGRNPENKFIAFIEIIFCLGKKNKLL